MTFTIDEQNLLILYYTDSRLDTLNTLKDMHRWLEMDEQDLKEMTEGLIAKLEQLTDEEFHALDVLNAMDL